MSKTPLDVVADALAPLVQPGTSNYVLIHFAEAAVKALQEKGLILSEKCMSVPIAGYGCHMDLEEGEEPDGCVIDEDRRSDCIYARRLTCKTQCQYWLPIPPKQNT